MPLDIIMDDKFILHVILGAFMFSAALLQAVGQAPTSSITILPNPVEEGSSVKFNCSYSIDSTRNFSQLTLSNTGIYNDVLFFKNETNQETISNLTSRLWVQPGEDFHTVILTDVQLVDEGDYSCGVTDDTGATASATETLEVQYLSTDISLEAEGKTFTGDTCTYPGSPHIVVYTPWSGDITCTQKDAKPKAALSLDVQNHTTGNFTFTSNPSVDQPTKADGTTTTTSTLSLDLGEPDTFYTVTCSATHGLRNQTACLIIKAEDPGDCASLPCQNGGTCTKTVSGYQCACAPDYTGTDCETKIDNCEGNPCKNSGTCSDGIETFTCACTSCWTGDTCTQKRINYCDNHSCKNGATCEDGCSGYQCLCDFGYRGADCDLTCNININVTSPSRVLLGDHVPLTCSSSTASVTVTWESASGSTISSDPEYNITAVTEPISDIYCLITDSDCKVRQSAGLQVYWEIIPNVTVTKDITIHKRGREDLTCAATGKPTPRLIWFFTPKPKSEDTDNDVSNMNENMTTEAPELVTEAQPQQIDNGTDESYTLELKDVKPSDAGQYVCIARLLGSKDITLKIYNVDVDMKPKKRNPKAWQLALIVLGCLLVVVLLVFLIVLLLKKLGKTPAICPADKSTALDRTSEDKRPLPGDNRYSDEGAEGNPGSNYFRLPEVHPNDRKAVNGHHEMNEVNKYKKSKGSRYQNDGEDERDSPMMSTKMTPRALPDMPDVQRGGGRALPPLDIEAERQRRTPKSKKKKKRSVEEEDEEEEDRNQDDEEDDNYYNNSRSRNAYFQ